MKLLYGHGLALKTGLVTEAGPLAIVQDGDKITIDLTSRDLHLHVSDEEIEKCLAAWRRPAPKYTRGYLGLNCQLAESADKGDVIRFNSDEGK